MGNPLTALDALIFSFHPDTLVSSRHSRKEYDQYHKLVSIELDKVCIYLTYKIYNSRSYAEAQFNVQLTQRGLISNQDIIYNHALRCKESLKNFYFRLIDEFSKSIKWVRAMYPEEFNYLALMPLDESEVYKFEFLMKIKDLKNKVHIIDPILIETLQVIIKKHFSNSINHKASYHSIEFLDNILKCIKQLLENKPSVDNTKELVNELLRLNFNHPLFSAYVLARTRSLLDLQTTKENKVNFLLKYNLELILIIPENDHKLNESTRSSLDITKDWIKQEIYFLRNAGASIQSSAIEPANDKIIIDLPVSQLSFLLFVISESKLLPNLKLSQISEFVVANFKTPNLENISLNSIRNKSYDAKKTTTDAVKTLLYSCIKIITDYKSRKLSSKP